MAEWSALLPVLTALAAVLVAAYLYSTRVALRYWRRRGVPHPATTAFFGNLLPAMLGRVKVATQLRYAVEPFVRQGRRYCGWYQWHMPCLVVWDPEVAKQILVKEFSSFHDRGIPVDEEADPLSANLFGLAGERWRNLRNKLSPTFTSGKLKLMFPLMEDVSRELHDTIRSEVTAAGEVDITDLLNRYATDVIGTCAFGIQCNSLRDRTSEFLLMSRQLFSATFFAMVRFFLMTLHPKLMRLLPFRVVFPKVNRFFLTLMADTVEHRKANKVERSDFVSLMMQLQEAERDQENREDHVELTHGVMTAQALIFFLAGLDNIANTVGFCLLQLALDQELQRRAAEEVRAVTRDHGGELSYEALRKMDLVDRILREGLRLWTPIGNLMRRCNSATVVGDLVIEKGTTVFIAVDVLHRCPELYPEPQRFDPERFTAEGSAGRHPYAFLPFGEGPRICIAERFALLEMRLALAKLLAEFHFSPCARTESTPELDTKSFFPQPKNGFWLKAEPRAAA